MNHPRKIRYIIGILAVMLLSVALSLTAFAEGAGKEKKELQVSATVSGHSITLSWKQVEGADLYRVYDMFGKELTTEPLKADDSLSDETLTYVIPHVTCSTLPYTYTVKGYEWTEVPAQPVDPDQGGADAGQPSEGDGTDAGQPGEGDGTDAGQPGESDGTGAGRSVEGDGTDAGQSVEGDSAAVSQSDDETDAAPQGESGEPVAGSTVKEETEICSGSASATVWVDMKVPVIGNCKFTGANQATVSWSSSTNASGYLVYRRVGNGSWEYVATVTGNTYIDKTVSLGKNYAYKVRAVSKCCENLSEYPTTGNSASYVPATKITSVSAASSSGVKVTWNGVSGAKGYYVYAKIDNGSWKKVATTTATNWTYNLSSSYWGKKISFQVYPYCAEYTAQASNVQYVVFQPAAPTMTGAKAVSTKENKITWNKVSGVHGYKVYRKTGSGSWSCIATLGSSTTSYSDKSVKFGTTYTYTVAGYWKSGSTVRSGFYNTSGMTVKPAITIKYKKVTDKKSVMYGKTLKLYYDIDGNQIQNVEQFVGSQSNYYLYVNKTNQYIIAYCKDGDYYVPVRAMICSTGKVLGATPNGTFTTKNKYQLHELNGPCWGWYCTRIVDHILFHSVPYKYNEDDLGDNKRLNVKYYNQLGNRASQGCIRLTTGDAYWIYQNCKLGTTVKIYESSGYEPLKKPTSYKLSSSHNWDPTSPFAKDKCKKNGCH